MSGPWHQTGRGKVSARSPRALAVCDRCGFTYNLCDLQWQYQWSGVKLQNLRLLVCTTDCLDKPQPQLKSIVIPADPTPVLNPRPEQYSVEVPSFVGFSTESGNDVVDEIEDTPLPDPNNPALYPPE